MSHSGPKRKPRPNENSQHVSNNAMAVTTTAHPLPTEQITVAPSLTPSELSPFLQSVKAHQSQIFNFVCAAKLHNKTERKQALVDFFNQFDEKFDIKLKTTFVTQIKFYFLQKHYIPYQLINKRLQVISENISQSSTSSNSKDLSEREQLEALFKQKTKESEQLFLQGFEKVNVWNSLLTEVLSNEDALKQQVMEDLFEDLPIALAYIINRYMLGRLQISDYSKVYEYIIEKTLWFKIFVEAYQLNMIEKIKLPSPTNDVSTYWLKVLNLLHCYSATICFLKNFNHTDTADQLIQMAEHFINYLKVCEAYFSQPQILNEDFTYQITNYQEKFEQLKKQTSSLATDPWFHFFRTLKFFHEHEWLAKNPLQSNLTIDLQAVNQTTQKLDIYNKTTASAYLQPLQMMVFELNNVLAHLGHYAQLPKYHYSHEIVDTYFKLSLKTFIFLNKNLPKDRTCLHHTALALFKRITDDIGDALKKHTSPIKPPRVQSNQPSELIKKPTPIEHNIVHDDGFTDAEIEAITDGMASIFFNDVLNDAPLPHNNSLMFTSEESEAKNKFNSTKNELLAQQQEEADAFNDSLIEKNKVQLEKLRQLHQKKLDNINQQHLLKLESIRKKRKKDFENQRRQQDNQAKLVVAKLTKEQQTVSQCLIENLETKYNKQLQLQKNVHDQEIAALKQSHQEQLNTLKENLKQQQIHILQTLDAQHQKSLIQLTHSLEVAHAQIISQSQKALKSDIASLKEKQSVEITTTQKQNEETLSALSEQLTKANHQQLTALKEQHAQNIAISKNHHQETMAAKTTEAIRGYTCRSIKDQIAKQQLSIPPMVSYILADLQQAGIEFYIVGGWVRNRLIGIPATIEEDYDIIVNANADQLQLALRGKARQNPLQEKQVTLGNVDFWCEPWEDLTTALARRDLTINSLICDIDGKVYDLLNIYADLYKPYLVMLGDTNQRFRTDPVLMLRYLRFSVQLGKQITDPDWISLHQQADQIIKLPFGIYLKNIDYMFCSRHAFACFYLIYHSGLLQSVFPFLLKDDTDYIKQTPAVYFFIAHKLNEFAQPVAQQSPYAILALMLFIPIVRNSIPISKLDVFIEGYLANYFEASLIPLSEKIRIKKGLNAYYINQEGLKTLTEEQSILTEQLHPPIISGYIEQFIQFSTDYHAQHNALRKVSLQHTSKDANLSEIASDKEYPPIMLVNYQRKRSNAKKGSSTSSIVVQNNAKRESTSFVKF